MPFRAFADYVCLISTTAVICIKGISLSLSRGWYKPSNYELFSLMSVSCQSLCPKSNPVQWSCQFTSSVVFPFLLPSTVPYETVLMSRPSGMRISKQLLVTFIYVYDWSLTLQTVSLAIFSYRRRPTCQSACIFLWLYKLPSCSAEIPSCTNTTETYWHLWDDPRPCHNSQGYYSPTRPPT